MSPLRRIYWESAAVNVVFEGPDEQNPPDWAPLIDFRPKRSKRQPAPVDTEVFQTFALLSTRHGSIAVILSFWREGSNEFEEGNFINAFYNYYFVLEGLYANKKFKSKEVLTEFKRQSGLRESVDMFLKQDTPVPHMIQVTNMLDARKFSRDIDGLIALIVYTRGDLHHFVDNPNRLQPSLFAQNQFEGLSSLMRFVSRRALMTRMIEVNNSFPEDT